MFSTYLGGSRSWLPLTCNWPLLFHTASLLGQMFIFGDNLSAAGIIIRYSSCRKGFIYLLTASLNTAGVQSQTYKEGLTFESANKSYCVTIHINFLSSSGIIRSSVLWISKYELEVFTWVFTLRLVFPVFRYEESILGNVSRFVLMFPPLRQPLADWCRH